MNITHLSVNMKFEFNPRPDSQQYRINAAYQIIRPTYRLVIHDFALRPRLLNQSSP
jgi:hypothetical protein